ncbi:unnamed protein product [Cylicocyclus nassatus]|uniref:Chorein N-terminal domain-containing protein n=1 Tax=Cylicocyclus nassatus TaxID=53992 RepID=A0AA36MHP4_CYLNA|nr:unnamed protein product [Cylicocyclus nassatus]
MANILKNQIIKHLSKFARNLKPEQISLDVLKGKSKLEFIELNEEVLTDVLELPSWLRIKRAYCIGVTVSVPWTRLKSSPVEIFVDEINVEVVLTSESPSRKQDRHVSTLSENSSYGFADKVIEGLSLYINTVEINFDSDAFGGSFMLSRLSVESRTPGWQTAQDLRQSRINCPAICRALVFKQISWQLLRIEASAKADRNEKRCTINAPLRLITSGGKIRLALKKNTNDGTVVNAQIHMLLEDILWVATLPQLRSAIAFSSYLMSLVRQCEKDYPPTPPVPTKTIETSVPNGQAITVSNTYRAFDFDQTSHHLHIKKVDLHLCDDAHSSMTYPPGWDIESGAMQVTLYRVLIDVYPRTLASCDRSHWPRYSAPNDFTRWLETRLAQQFTAFCTGTDEAGRTRLVQCWPQLMSFNVVLRIHDLTIQCVSDANSKRESLQNMFASERHLRSLPNDQYIFHLEFSLFTHPMSNTLSVPAPASFLQLGPFSMLLDKRTLRWCLYVVHNLSTAFEQSLGFDMEPSPHSDLRVDLLMPKIIIPFPSPSSDDRRFPLRLLISFSTLSVSNTQFDSDIFKPFEMLNKATISFVTKTELLGGRSTLVDDMTQLTGSSHPKGVKDLFWLRTSPAWIDTDHGANTKSLPVISDVCFSGVILARTDQLNVYVEPTTQISAVVDHFQFLQLTRLSTSLSDFLDILTADQKHFDSERSSTSPTVSVVVAVKQARANILLTMGPMPSPYDNCPAVTESILDNLSAPSGPSRNNTPRSTPAPPPVEPPKPTPTRVVESFPEFKAAPDYDASSFIDDSTSITTSTEDENFEMDIVPEEDDLDLADIAEDAAAIDDAIINDRIYKVLMARQGNILIVDLVTVIVILNVHNKNTLVLGKVDKVLASQKLNVARYEAYEDFRKKGISMENKRASDPEVMFTVSSPAQTPTTRVQIDLNGITAQIDDEILSHWSAFVQDDEVTKSKVRVVINISDTIVEIQDRKKKKPMRLKIKQCIVEHEEDHNDT